VPEERIQKVLAAAGVASRRAAEELVAAGRVRVDGKRATIGQKVDPASATIDVDGTPVGIGAARAYVALHKPAGVTSTTRDRHAATTVLELIPTALAPDGTRLYPVGRLDQDSEGLLLLTNDGDWAERVSRVSRSRSAPRRGRRHGSSRKRWIPGRIPRSPGTARRSPRDGSASCAVCSAQSRHRSHASFASGSVRPGWATSAPAVPAR
jgi:hypothetical protein